MADLQVDLFWSFRSPWSYLATPRLRALQEQFEVTVNFRPVYPIAIRSPDFFLSVDPLWPGYLMTDVHRCAEFLNIALSLAEPRSRQTISGRTGPTPHGGGSDLYLSIDSPGHCRCRSRSRH